MSREKLVSIALPVYNGEKYIREQLDSIYNQTYKNIEVVVSDDCSTDGTVKILEEYSQKYGLKYCVNEKNLGLNKNYVQAASLASGEYIAFSDCDDIWLPEKIEILMEELGDFTMVHSDSKFLKNGEIISESMKRTKGQINYCLDSGKWVHYVNFVTGHSILFKRELLEKALPIPKLLPGEYIDHWLPIVAARMNGLKYVDIPLVLYRLHDTNITKQKNEKIYNIIHKVYMILGKNIYRQIRKLYKDSILLTRGL